MSLDTTGEGGQQVRAGQCLCVLCELLQVHPWALGALQGGCLRCSLENNRKPGAKKAHSQFGFLLCRQPKEISVFSLDHDRQFHHDKSQLRAYAPPPNAGNVAFDLRAGYDRFIQRDETKKEHLDHLLKCILQSTDQFLPHSTVQGQTADKLRWGIAIVMSGLKFFAH